MALNPYLQEKLINERHAKIRQDMQQSQRQVHTEQRWMLTGMSKFGTLLIALGYRLQRSGQQSTAHP